MDFINRMIQNFDAYCRRENGNDFTDQRESSCETIYDLCVKENPDGVKWPRIELDEKN